MLSTGSLPPCIQRASSFHPSLTPYAFSISSCLSSATRKQLPVQAEHDARFSRGTRQQQRAETTRHPAPCSVAAPAGPQRCWRYVASFQLTHCQDSACCSQQAVAVAKQHLLRPRSLRPVSIDHKPHADQQPDLLLLLLLSCLLICIMLSPLSGRPQIAVLRRCRTTVF